MTHNCRFILIQVERKVDNPDRATFSHKYRFLFFLELMVICFFGLISSFIRFICTALHSTSGSSDAVSRRPYCPSYLVYMQTTRLLFTHSSSSLDDSTHRPVIDSNNDGINVTRFPNRFIAHNPILDIGPKP